MSRRNKTKGPALILVPDDDEDGNTVAAFESVCKSVKAMMRSKQQLVGIFVSFANIVTSNHYVCRIQTPRSSVARDSMKKKSRRQYTR